MFLNGDENSRKKAEELINEITVNKEQIGFTIVDTFSQPQTEFNAEPEVVDWKKLSEECVSKQALKLL